MSSALALDFYRHKNYGHCERLVSPGNPVEAEIHSIGFQLLPIDLCAVSEVL